MGRRRKSLRCLSDAGYVGRWQGFNRIRPAARVAVRVDHDRQTVERWARCTWDN